MFQPSQGQRGQVMAGYIVAILVLVALATYVIKNMASLRTNTQRQIYRELALNVARNGFEEGLAYFRAQTDGVYLAAYPAVAPTS